jgi:hypothetical protein
MSGVGRLSTHRAILHATCCVQNRRDQIDEARWNSRQCKCKMDRMERDEVEECRVVRGGRYLSGGQDGVHVMRSITRLNNKSHRNVAMWH